MDDKLTIITNQFEDIPVAKDYQYDMDEVFDMVHVAIASRPQVECQTKHTFTKGLYCREIFMPAGLDIISKWHKTQHQFVVLSGSVEVLLKFNKEWVLLEAPLRGITEPGTRRVLRTITDTTWLTFHPTGIFPENDSKEALLLAVEKVEEAIIHKHENLLLNAMEAPEALSE